MPVILDPDAAAVLQAFRDAGRPPYETLTAPEARDYYLAARTLTNPEPPALAAIRDFTLPGPAGAIPARLYTPLGLRQSGSLCEG